MTSTGSLTFSSDDDGVFTFGGGRFYKKSGTGLMIRLHDANTPLQCENNSGTVLGTYFHSGNDGAGSGLDADLLDGQHGSYYLNASNISSGTIPAARVGDITGNAASADTVDVSGASNQNATFMVAFTDNTGSGKTIKVDGDLEYNPSSNTLTTDTFSGALSGNASTATKLATARTIAGVSFDGSANISLNNNAITNGAGYTTFSGSYNDLSNKPTIPTNNNQLSNGAGYITSVSGQNYNSLSNLPTIPTNNNQLSNGAGYITSVSGQNYNSLSNKPTIPTNNNQLSNGAGYAAVSDFPCFSARLSSGQSISSGTYTKINFNSEDFDTHGAHSNGRFTCPSGKAGKYFFNGFFSVDDIRERDRNQFKFYKNGANSNFGFGYHRLVDQNNNQIITTHMSAIIDLAVGDYVEMYGFHNDGSTQQIEHTEGLTLFQGFRIAAS